MVKQTLLLIGPTIMVFIGLSLLHNVLITFLLFYGWLLIAPIIVTYWDKSFKSNAKFYISKSSIVVGLVSGFICLISIYGFVAFFQSSVVNIPELQQLLEEWDFSGKKVLLLILVLILVNPILEEFYWREFTFRKLLHNMGSLKTIMITSIFYSLYHVIVVAEIFSFPFNAFAVIPVFLAGIMWGILRIKFNNIAVTIISHCLADIGIMLVYWHIVM